MRGDPLEVGDRITWSEYFFDGQCYYREVLDMPQKCHGVRKYGHDLAAEDPHFLGGFAEYCYILPGTCILKLPDELSDEEATPLNCGVATMASVTEAAEIGLGDAVVMQGLGLLGLYGCRDGQGARRAVRDRSRYGGEPARPSQKNSAPIIVIDIARVPAKDVIDEVRALCRPDGADAVIEVCGVPDVIPQGLQMLRTGGRYVLGGLVSPGANVTIDANMLLRRWITMRGIHNYHPRHLIQALDFVMANRERFPFKDIVDFEIRLEGSRRRFQESVGAHGATRRDRSRDYKG